MSGKAITPEQVKLFMKKRTEGDTQQQACAKVGISDRSGQRIDSGILPKNKEPRHWRTRKDPFAEGKLELISENPATQKPNRQSISYRRKGC